MQNNANKTMQINVDLTMVNDYNENIGGVYYERLSN